MRRQLLAVVLSHLAGCHLVFELDEAPDAPVLPPPCLSADFEDNERDQGWTLEVAANDPVTIGEVNGRLEMRIDMLSTGYNWLSTIMAQDLTQASLEIELVDAPPVNSVIELGAFLDFMNYYRFSVATTATGTELQFMRAFSGSVTTASAPFNPLKHKLLRLRHDLATLYWETSDGVQWAVAHETDAVVAVGALRVRLGASTFSSGPPTDGVSRLDNLLLDTPTCEP